MKVSVIVPVYNVEDCVDRCLDSLVNQTLKEIEIIVVNDGSTDNSQKHIEFYADKYSNVHVYQKDNGGLSDARNFGLRYARGEFISFVDSDDYIELDTFEKMYLKAKNEDLELVVCDTVMQYPDHSYVLRSNMHYTDDVVKAYIFSSPMACTRLVKKTVMDKFTFQKGTLYEDLNLTPTYIVETNRIGFLEEPLYHYVQRNNSIMNQTVFSDRLLDIFSVLEHVTDVYKKANIYEKYFEEIEYLYVIHLLRSATLRFLQYAKSNQYLEKINEIMRVNFPNWKKNTYFKKSAIKFKIVCYLAYSRQYKLLKILSNVK